MRMARLCVGLSALMAAMTAPAAATPYAATFFGGVMLDDVWEDVFRKRSE